MLKECFSCLSNEPINNYCTYTCETVLQTITVYTVGIKQLVQITYDSKETFLLTLKTPKKDALGSWSLVWTCHSPAAGDMGTADVARAVNCNVCNVRNLRLQGDRKDRWSSLQWQTTCNHVVPQTRLKTCKNLGGIEK